MFHKQDIMIHNKNKITENEVGVEHLRSAMKAKRGRLISKRTRNHRVSYQNRQLHSSCVIYFNTV